MQKVKAHGFRILVHVGALWPLARILWDLATGQFLVDPVREITTRTGRSALILLLLSLACTPVYAMSGFKSAARARRTLGLYAFSYAGLHFLTFAGWDYGFNVRLLWDAVFYQRYVIVGFAAGLILLALAVTSTKGWQQRLGKGWKRLQRWVYAAGILAILHFVWLRKDPREPLRYGAVLVVLLALRFSPVAKRLRKVRGWFRKRVGVENNGRKIGTS